MFQNAKSKKYFWSTLMEGVAQQFPSVISLNFLQFLKEKIGQIRFLKKFEKVQFSQYFLEADVATRFPPHS